MGAISVILAVWISLIRTGPPPTPQHETRQGYHFEGHQIPKYFVVKEFYSLCYEKRNSADFQKEIREWGIRSGSPAEEIFLQSIKEGNWVITEKLDARPYVNDPARWEEVQDAFLRKQVHALRDLHRKYMRALAAAGVDVRAIDEYIETFRNSMSIGSTSPNLDPKGIWAEFETDDPDSPSPLP